MSFPPCNSHNEQRLFFWHILYRLAHNEGGLCFMWGRNWICVFCSDETCVCSRTSPYGICSGTKWHWVRFLFEYFCLALFGAFRQWFVFMFTFKAAWLRLGQTGDVLGTYNKSDTIPRRGVHEERKPSLCRLRYHHHHHHHNVSSSYTFRNNTNMMTLSLRLQSWAVYVGYLWWTQDSVCRSTAFCHVHHRTVELQLLNVH